MRRRKKGGVTMSHSEAEEFLKKWDLMWQTGISEPVYNGKLEAMNSYNVAPTKDAYPMPQNLIRVEAAVVIQDLVSADKLTKAQPGSFLTKMNGAVEKEGASPGQVSKEEKVRQLWVAGKLQKEERVSRVSNSSLSEQTNTEKVVSRISRDSNSKSLAEKPNVLFIMKCYI